MAATTAAENMVTVAIVQVELRTDRRTNDYSVVDYQARDGFESADGRSKWCDLDEIRPPLGFAWATGGMWSVPDTYTYDDCGSREAPRQRVACCAATKIEMNIPSSDERPTDIEEPQQELVRTPRGPLRALLSSDRGPKLVQDALSPQSGPQADTEAVEVQRLLQCTLIASAAAHEDTQVAKDRHIHHLQVGTNVEVKDDHGDYDRRATVTKKHNNATVCLDDGDAPMPIDKLRAACLTDLEHYLASYSRAGRFSRVTFATQRALPQVRTPPQPHLLLELADAPELLIVAVRGCQKSPLKERSAWTTNLSASTRIAATHEGFSARADTIPLLPLLDHLRRGGSVLFTGHSLGSAVAEIVCQRIIDECRAKGAPATLASALKERRVAFIGWASPAIGTAEYNVEKSEDAEHFFHISDQHDIVPHLSNLVASLPLLCGLKCVKPLVHWLPVVSAVAPTFAGIIQQFETKFESKMLAPLEPARGYHFSRNRDHSYATYFIKDVAVPVLRTSTFVHNLRVDNAFIACCSRHTVNPSANQYQQAAAPPRTNPLWVPKVSSMLSRDESKARAQGGITYYNTYRQLTLTLDGDSAMLLATGEVQLRITNTGSGHQTVHSCAHLCSTTDASSCRDVTTATFAAVNLPPKGCIVTFHLTPRYAGQCYSRTLTGPVTRVVDMSVLSTLQQALFLSVGADEPNAFTKQLELRLVTLERLSSNLPALQPLEINSAAEEAQVMRRTLGDCRLLLSADPSAVYALVRVGGSSKSEQALRSTGAFSSGTFDLTTDGWTITPTANDEELYDMTPLTAGALNLQGVKLSFADGAYTIRRAGEVLDTTDSGWLRSVVKAGFEKKKDSKTTFLIYCVKEGGKPLPLRPLVPPCGGADDVVAKCARVIVHREAHNEALAPAVFLRICTDPEAFLRDDLREEERVPVHGSVKANVEDAILDGHAGGKRIVDVLRDHNTLPPAVPLSKVLRQRRCKPQQKAATQREPPVSRYFFCGLPSITSCVLALCSLPPVTAEPRDKLLTRLYKSLFATDTRDQMVDKSYATQLELLCSVLDDERFDDARASLQLRRSGNVSKPKTLTDLHTRLLAHHTQYMPKSAVEGDADGVLQFALGWGTGKPLKLRDGGNIPAERKALIGVAYAMMVTVALLERDVAKCCAAAAFGLKGAGKSTLIHALSGGRINPPTRGSDVDTLEAVAFFGQTPETEHVCVVDCPGTNEDRHELRCVQRLMFGAVKLVFVVQSLNKEAKNQIEVLRSVLDNTNPDAEIFVVFTRFDTRFAESWQERLADGLELQLIDDASGSRSFAFDGRTYMGTPFNVLEAGTLTLAAVEDGVLRLLDGEKWVGDYRATDSDVNDTSPPRERLAGENSQYIASGDASSVESPQSPVRRSVKVSAYVPLKISPAQFDKLFDVTKILQGLMHEGLVAHTAAHLENTLVQKLGNDKRTVWIVNKLFPVLFEACDIVGLNKALSRELKKGIASLTTAALDDSSSGSELSEPQYSSHTPLQTIEAIRKCIRTTFAEMGAACLALRRVPLHHCVIFYPKMGEKPKPLFEVSTFSEAVHTELEEDVLLGARTDPESRLPYFTGLQKTESGRLRLIRPSDTEYKGNAAKLHRLLCHPTMAGRTVFDQDDLRSLIESSVGVTTVDKSIFHFLFGGVSTSGPAVSVA
jgi:hypothetical protein